MARVRTDDGARLFALRERLGLSQREVADVLGVTPGAIAHAPKIERLAEPDRSTEAIRGALLRNCGRHDILFASYARGGDREARDHRRELDHARLVIQARTASPCACRVQLRCKRTYSVVAIRRIDDRRPALPRPDSRRKRDSDTAWVDADTHVGDA